jgi:hypothetical protein
VLHMQAIGHDGMSGIDSSSMHEATIQRAATIDRYATKFLQKGTNVRGSIEFPAPLTDPQLEQMRGYLRQHFAGEFGDEDVLLLTAGATLKNTTLSPKDSELLAQGVHSTKQISQITGVDPAFLFDKSESKYTGIEDAGQNVVRYLFRPIIKQIEDELTLKLLTREERRAGYSIGINPDALLRGDTKAQSENVRAEVTAGLRTANEGRELLGLPKVDDPAADQLKRTGDTSPGGEPSASPPVARPAQAPAATAPQPPAAPAAPLNGYQINSALNVIQKYAAGEISKAIAAGLLAALGFAAEQAEAMLSTVTVATPSTTPVVPPTA